MHWPQALAVCLLAAAVALPAAGVTGAGAGSYTVENIDLDPGQTFGVEPGLVALNTVTHKLYVLSPNGVLSIFGSDTGVFVTSFIAGSGKFSDIVASGALNRVFITDEARDTLIVINGATDSLEAEIPVGTAPQRIAVNPASGRVYVTNYGTMANPVNNTVTVVSAATNTVETTITVGVNPVGIVRTAANFLYVANEGSGDVSVIQALASHPDFNTVVATIPISGGFEDWGPAFVAANNVTGRVYVLNRGNPEFDVQTSVAVIDGATHALVDLGAQRNPVPVPGTYWSNGISVRERYDLFVVLNSRDIDGNDLHTWTVMNGATGAVEASGPNQDLEGPITSSVRNETLQKAYVVANGAVYCVDIDPLSPTFFDASMMAGMGTSDRHKTLALDEAAGVLYFTSQANLVAAMSLADNTILGFMFPGGGPTGLDVDALRDRVWVGHFGGGFTGTQGVRRVEGATGAVTAVETGVLVGRHVAHSETTNWAYTPDLMNGALVPVDGEAATAALGISVAGIQGMALDETRGLAYPVSNSDNTLRVVDVDPGSPTFHTVLATIPVCGDPEGVAVSEADNWVYVGCNDGHVAAVDGATRTVAAQIPVAPWSDRIAVNGATRRAYISSDDEASPAVRVIDIDPGSPGFNTVIQTIPIGGKSEGIAVNEATGRVYVNIDGISTLGVINGATGLVEALVPVPGSEEMPFAVDAGLGRVYAADGAQNLVYVIDADPASPGFNTIIESIDTGWSPASIGINPVTHKVYTANYGDNTLSVITPPSGACPAGCDDFVVDLGPGAGVWVSYNDDPASWRQVHPSSPGSLLTGDIDGSGRDEVVLDFGAAGVWANYNDDPAAWRQIHGSSPEGMVTGDLDGSGRDEVILDFGAAFGVWANYNDDPALWRRIHTSSPEAMATGDLDGSGRDDVVFDYGAFGVWVNYNDDPALWRQVHASSPEKMLVADLDGSGRDDLVLDFGAVSGIWVNYNDDPASWRQVHTGSPEIMVAGDIDGGGRADLVLDFGAAFGVWANLNDDPASWRQVHTSSPEGMITGDLDGSGRDEVILDYGAAFGIWVNYDNDPALWSQVHGSAGVSMTTGNVDGM